MGSSQLGAKLTGAEAEDITAYKLWLRSGPSRAPLRNQTLIALIASCKVLAG